MKNYITEYIESGILEMYILGLVNAAEAEEVEQMAATHVAVRRELATIQATMEQYALVHAVTPRPVVKLLFLATIDYLERLKQGEPATFPPTLTETSRVADYAAWLNRADLIAPAVFDSIYIKIIGHTPEITSAIVWLKNQTDEEVHDQEYERFLIVEGACAVTAGSEVYHLGPGDYYAVPLHTPHVIRVTSTQPCKVILQRVAA